MVVLGMFSPLETVSCDDFRDYDATINLNVMNVQWIEKADDSDGMNLVILICVSNDFPEVSQNWLFLDVFRSWQSMIKMLLTD
jgi:hypothetical protein